MPDTTIIGIDDSSAQKLPARRSKHVGLLNAESIALYINDTEEPLILRFSHEITLGRLALHSTTPPTVDLTRFGAYEKGVSRLHVIIRRTESGNVEAQDQGGANGTWLNGIRLEPFARVRLKSGDRLTLAKLNVEIYLANDATQPTRPTTEKVFESDNLLIQAATTPLDVPLGHVLVAKPPVQLAVQTPPKLCHYHASVSLPAQPAPSDLEAVLVKLIPELLKLKDCQVKLMLQIDAYMPYGFDETTIRAMKDKEASGDLKLNESDFRPY